MIRAELALPFELIGDRRDPPLGEVAHGATDVLVLGERAKSIDGAAPLRIPGSGVPAIESTKERPDRTGPIGPWRRSLVGATPGSRSRRLRCSRACPTFAAYGASLLVSVDAASGGWPAMSAPALEYVTFYDAQGREEVAQFRTVVVRLTLALDRRKYAQRVANPHRGR